MVLKSIKSYLKKESSEYMEGNIDPFEFHKTFYFGLKLCGAVDEPVSKWTLFLPIYVSFCGAIASAVCFLSMGHSAKAMDIPGFTEGLTYFVIMIYKLFIISCSKTDKKHIFNLLQAMRDDFNYICVTNTKYREKFFKNHLFTRKYCILTSAFICAVAGSIILFADVALLYYLATHEPNDGTIRPLPFPFWAFDVNFGKSPVYEISLLFSNMCIFSQMYTYVFMMQTQVIWIRQITSKADVVIWGIQDLFNDIHPAKNEEEHKHYAAVIKSRMREIIQIHQSMFRLIDDYIGVYRKLLMFEQKVCAPMVCLTAYSSAEKLDEGEIDLILILLCVAIIVLLFIPSYMCTFLTGKVKSISDACWETPFWNAGPVIRPYIVLIMQRSMRPLPLHSPGFETVSIETFSKKLTSAYSAFNMLRQTNFQ